MSVLARGTAATVPGRALLRLLRLLGLLGLLGLLAAPVLAGAADSGSPAPRPALTVSAEPARIEPWPSLIDASGAIAPWQEASVAARVAGLPLVEVRAEVGDRVRRGALLARYDDATVRAELAQAEATLAQAEASARQAEANRDRVLRLKDNGALSAQDILQYTTIATATAAQRRQAEAAVASARLQLGYTRVVAPDDGVITARSASLGAVAQPGSELFRMIRQGRLEWRAELTAAQLAQVKPGMQASVALPDGTVASGRVRALSPALDPATRLGIAYVDLKAGSSARAAMYLRGRLAGAARPALTVPAESVVIRDGRSYVFELVDSRARRVAVDTGRREGTRIEIVRGLASGQLVVVRGAGFLNDQDLVRVAPATPAAQPAAADAKR